MFVFSFPLRFPFALSTPQHRPYPLFFSSFVFDPFWPGSLLQAVLLASFGFSCSLLAVRSAPCLSRPSPPSVHVALATGFSSPVLLRCVNLRLATTSPSRSFRTPGCFSPFAPAPFTDPSRRLAPSLCPLLYLLISSVCLPSERFAFYLHSKP